MINTPLRKGDYNEDVRLLQVALKRAGYDVLVDADFGPITLDAVKAYQLKLGVEPNGIVGPFFIEKLTQQKPIPILPVDLPAARASIYVFLMYGLGDEWTSAGMDVLAASIKARGPRFVVAPTVSWTNRAAVVDKIGKLPKGSLVMLFGNSMGANAIPMVTNAVGDRVRIILVGGYDPTIWWSCPAFGTNVERGILYHGINWLNPIGHARYTEAYPGQIEVVKTSTLHGSVDDDLRLHRHTLDAIDRIAAMTEKVS